jgi:hypothetical protein
MTEAFPNGDVVPRTDEIVDVTEDASVLTILLKFVHPSRPPVSDSFSPLLVIKLAEAVEKYGVFSGMEVCRLKMRFLDLPYCLATLMSEIEI